MSTGCIWSQSSPVKSRQDASIRSPNVHQALCKFTNLDLITLYETKLKLFNRVISAERRLADGDGLKPSRELVISFN